MAKAQVNFDSLGGGQIETGSFTLPINSASVTIPLSFTPTKVFVYYSNGTSSYTVLGVNDTDNNLNTSVEGGGSTNRLAISITTNGFSVSFPASASQWQAANAYYIAV